jgi:tRNA pseudouridine38-40 synthase
VPRTLKLTIAYDGTDFAGWQRQASDRTVQATIEDALLPIEGSRAIVIAAGRTDAGVHAAGQVASVVLSARIAAADLLRALNATLPQDVRITAVDDMPDGFNAQFAATQKTYRYSVWATGVVPPPLRRFVWHVPQLLDRAAMDAAAQRVLGTHDFSAFQAAGSDVITTRRTLTASRVIEIAPSSSALLVGPAVVGAWLVYEVTGTGFLRHMVRNIAGSLVDIGRGRRAIDDVSRILESRNRAMAAATAPPQGLTLWSVEY